MPELEERTPPEAPVEALAVELEGRRERWMGTAAVSVLSEAARDVRERLAPAWDALTAERDEARRQLAVQHEAMTQLRAGHREAIAGAESQARAAARDMAERSGAAEARLVLAEAEVRKLRERLAASEAYGAASGLSRVLAEAARHQAERDDARELLADILDPQRWEARPPHVVLTVHGDQLASWRGRAGTEPQSWRPGEGGVMETAP